MLKLPQKVRLIFLLLVIFLFNFSSTKAQTDIYPAQVFDLTNWKLQLPSGQENDPDEISASGLNTYKSEWFELDPNKVSIMFKARTDGVTTANSNYPRSELREMRNNGTQNAAWSPSDGKSHSLFYDVAIQGTPSFRPLVVIGQVHDGSDDVITVRYSGNDTGNQKGLHLTAYTQPNNQGRVDVPLEPNYVMGSRFTIKFEVLGSNPGFTDVYYNDTKVYTLNRNYGPNAYFKLGVYPQSSCILTPAEDCSSAGSAHYFNLKVCHDGVCTGGRKPPTACTADINQDGIVDLSDYSKLVVNFFKSFPNWNDFRADINGDNFVDLTDYSHLVSFFFQGCPR